MIVAPDPELAPVIFPVIAPTDQLNVLAMLDVRFISGPTPLQVLAVIEFVTAGDGFTVNVTVTDGPVHPANDVGVIMYCTVPAIVLLGLVNT